MAGAFILSRPNVPPPPPPATHIRAAMLWRGPDGSVWDLVNGTEGVRLLLGDVEGLHNPVLTHFTSQSRPVPGVRPRGWRAQAREVFWPIMVDADTSEEWLELVARFFATIHPDQEGTWEFTSARGTRSLRLHAKFEDPHVYGQDPVLAGSATYGVTLQADQPYWVGESVPAGPWVASDPLPFFDPAGSPPFHISRQLTLGNAVMDNPGDVDSYPVWTVTGPLTDIELGVGSRTIQVPPTLTVHEGQVLTIDTDPRNVTATRNGVDVTAQLGFQRFAPIPAGRRVPIRTQGTGAGSVACELTPLYFRAF